uniref:F-box/LRR-repeat protein At3g03360-like n=1 Tax=Erigeron canadensis TaxID=72917 RepID=UPI001CB953D8|nr:F-box/LRR-repeat protein At3g03360-like [Erigeron canadensis]
MFAGESSTQGKDRTKRFKEDESEKGEDRISTLPDDIIADKILSRDFDTKFLISTGIISKRWQHLWKFVPYLVFSDESLRKKVEESLFVFGFGDKPFLEFYNGVNGALAQYRLQSVTKFEVDVNYNARFSQDVKRWIEFALSRYVKEFSLNLRHLGDHDTYSIISDLFYKSSDFTSLDIGYCLLRPNVAIAWKNLNKLTISKSRLEDELIPNIVRGRPLLHTLIICNCRGYVINIPSRSVKHLEIHGFESDELETLLEIVAPYITHLTIVDSLWISNISLTDVSSVVKAYLNFEFPHFSHRIKKPYAELLLGEMVTNLDQATEVEIGISCYPIICRMASKGYTLPPNVVGVDTSSIYYADSNVEVIDSETE